MANGQGLAFGWIRFFGGLVASTWRITGRGDPGSIVGDLILLSLVATVALIPLIVLTAVYVVQKVIGAFTSRVP